MEILEIYSEAVEQFLEKEIAVLIQKQADSDIAEPMIYSLMAGGKRIRPFLTLISAGVPLVENFDSAHMDGYQKSAFFAGAALEIIHTYSLIHDDLPSMDNDLLRRGKPSCHAEFGEWRAILAGDALNTFAFGILPFVAKYSKENILERLIFLLNEAAGIGGMICGQALDLAAEKENSSESQNSSEKKDHLKKIHLNKTAAMIRASCEMGALISGSERMDVYRKYGETLGLLFQIADDILDVTGSSEELGKTAGKDSLSGKLTYPSLYGLEKSKAIAMEMADELKRLSFDLLPGPFARNDFRQVFHDLPEFIYSRKN
ncbi:MAG: polyprenyl synthetase family protein [Spirochaetia bacterium]|nr:polyprenyl synthetase family protein [Spirochaetia bacterium]